MAKKKKKQGALVDLKNPKTRNILIVIAVVVIALSLALGYGTAPGKVDNNDQQGAPAPDSRQDTSIEALNDTKEVTINTEEGDIVIEVYPSAMPVTVENFEKLIADGFYDGLTFHRVEDWVVQGGDPNGDGAGGPGWTIPLEIHPGLKNERGMVAMARKGNDRDSAGSQFYILKEDAPGLDGDYAVFGKVLAGMDIVDNMEVGFVINNVTIK